MAPARNPAKPQRRSYFFDALMPARYRVPRPGAGSTSRPATLRSSERTEVNFTSSMEPAVSTRIGALSSTARRMDRRVAESHFRKGPRIQHPIEVDVKLSEGLDFTEPGNGLLGERSEFGSE